jgi:hypothetical protein
LTPYLGNSERKIGLHITLYRIHLLSRESTSRIGGPYDENTVIKKKK